MTAVLTAALMLCLGVPGSPDPGEPAAPQYRGGRGGAASTGGGTKVWLNIESLRAPLEADDASGTDPATHSDDGFDSGIDTYLQQTTSTINLGFQADTSLTLYGKIGFANTTMVQDTDAGSLVGGPSRRGGGIDPYLIYGGGLEYVQAASPTAGIFARLEFTTGKGDLDNGYAFHDAIGEGDLEFKRFEARVGLMHQMQAAAAYVGVRYNLLILELDLTDYAPGTDSFDVEYEYEDPIGLFVGIGNRTGAQMLWHAELGFLDNDQFSFEVGAGLTF